MGYDVNVFMPTGGMIEDEYGGGHFPSRLRGESSNYTYNVSPMFRRAFGDDDGIRSIHERECRDAAPMLRDAIADMVASPNSYRAMNPENGWWDYEGALDFLRWILAECTKHPDAFVEIS